MAWDEWEQLKAEAADKQSDRMQLNGDTVDGGRAAPTVQPGILKASQRDLAEIGQSAHKLYDRLWREGRAAIPSSDKAAGDLSSQGFAVGGALKYVSTRWEEQLKSLMDACAHISNHMRITKKTHQDSEDAIQRQMSSIAILDEGFNESYAKPGKRNKEDN